MSEANAVQKSEADKIKEFVYWISTAPTHLTLSPHEFNNLLWSKLPRYQFMRLLPHAGTLLDIGAGSGGLVALRGGPQPRPDLRMFGVDLRSPTESPWIAQYEGWEVVNLDQDKPKFPGIRFDGFYASHLIEHLASLNDLVAWIASAAAPRAYVYFEWPSPKSVMFPTKEEFFAKTGMPGVDTINFFDDPTHKHALEPKLVCDTLEKFGFRIDQAGDVDLGLVGLEAIARGRDSKGDMQSGIWFSTGWATYVVAQKRF
jgi:Methyltransferase domain